MDLSAQLVAEKIALDLENRVSFRRAMKGSIGRTMKSGAKGIKIKCGGRLGGAEIARSECYHEGTIPLQTIRADIDYGFAEANTTYGRIGIKVWVNNGEYLESGLIPAIPEEKENKREGRGDRKNGRKRDNNRGERRERDNNGRRNNRFEEEKPKKAVNPRKRPEKPVEVVEEVVEAVAETAAEE